MKEYIDEKGLYWASYKEYVFTGLLGCCGCFDNELFNDIFKILKAYYKAKKQDKFLYYDKILKKEKRKYIEFILHIMTNADLLEHGGSVRGSWLTDKGLDVCSTLFEVSTANKNDTSQVTTEEEEVK